MLWFLITNVVAESAHIHTKIENTVFYLSQDLQYD